MKKERRERQIIKRLASVFLALVLVTSCVMPTHVNAKPNDEDALSSVATIQKPTLLEGDSCVEDNSEVELTEGAASAVE